ncbi:MAG: hypothetical protein ACN6O3_09335 [Comamonas sp.]
MVIFKQLPSCKAVGPWTLAFFAGAAFAQAPVDAKAPALPTALQYTPAIASYQAYKDEPVQSWREANDRVGQIGGWKAYAKEARESQQPQAKPANDAAPAKDPHAGHDMGGKP